MKRIDLSSKISLLMIGVIVLLLTGSCSKDDAYTPKLGDTYQGGIIFFIDATGKHGLIASPEDLTKTIPWWGGGLTVTNATSTTDGSSNTIAIINVLGNSGSYAAKLCGDYNGGSQNDWFLPSKDQLNTLYTKRALVGGFTDDLLYWSSTEYNDEYAWSQYFLDGSPGVMPKISGSVFGVRAVRAF